MNARVAVSMVALLLTALLAEGNDTGHPFELTVVDTEGKPLPSVSIQIRSQPKVVASQITRGKFEQKSTYGSDVVTDTEGRLAIHLPKLPPILSFRIDPPGYAPYWAEFDSQKNPDAFPTAFTAVLDTGWSVGGTLIDAEGRLIAGAEVSPNVYFKKRPGDTQRLYVGTRIKTDAQGHWRYDTVPAQLTEVRVSINHPDFQSSRLNLNREIYGIDINEVPSKTLTLDRGVVVRGTVFDHSGEPIVGALVRTKFTNDRREATTDASGRYEISGCESRMARIVASAKGRTMELEEVRVGPDMDPVDFVLKPGGHVRIRVVDADGKGIPKARVFFQRWRGSIEYFEFDHVDQYADENRVWQWDEAPLDPFEADICRPGGLQLSDQSIVAREEEFVFRPPTALIISGKVANADTGEPITNFRVVPGLRNSDADIGIDWIPRDAYTATQSDYRYQFHHTSVAHIIRIEAPGYLVTDSRDFATDEGEVTFDFDLKPASDIVANIVSIDGKPAARAKIALGVAGSQISVDNGDIDDSSTYATRFDADATGEFRFPTRSEPFHLVIVHDFGFAHLKSATNTIGPSIELTPWATVEGVFRVAGEPVENIEISLNSGDVHSSGNGSPRIFTTHETTSGAGGRFRFQRVFPGTGSMGRNITMMVDDGATEVTSSKRIRIQPVAGELQAVDLGGDGRAVTGKLLPPPDHQTKVLWNFAMVNADTPVLVPVAPVDLVALRKDAKAYRAWLNTDVGVAWTASIQRYRDQQDRQIQYRATVARDGTFRFDDVIPGRYDFRVDFSNREKLGIRNAEFDVPEGDDLYDLGEIPLATP
ncbi:Nickel uptake substrate-specific transmembrane region [Rubripirellula tenax]|uniref:Nickel uptake substrate-specific transmembrane region n=1 Tax=Rubripirellula tenax TaxID=2528015 RepID=A0A5C6ERX0_9BACT|nr:carboxypeptidase-like regulatory domain-containing protein [Rubripirellula tenax]TWU51070.1 Nickel uptake substrate-specific transmembrane region [Rubripirellula tenax]